MPVKYIKAKVKEKRGELYIFSELILFSMYPVITVILFTSISPLAALAGSTFFAIPFFVILVTMRRDWHYLKDPKAVWYIFLVVLFIGVLYYGLFFWGLKHTTPGNAALIGLMEVFFTFLLFNVWKHEYISIQHILGVIFMLIGSAILLYPQEIVFYKGDMLILLACMFAPFGNHFQQKARERASAEFITMLRNIMSCTFVFSLCYLLGELPSAAQLGESYWLLIINGTILLGLAKVFWIEGINLISVTKAISLHSVGPLFTLLFAYLILGQAATWYQIISFFPMVIGLILLVSKGENKILAHYIE